MMQVQLLKHAAMATTFDFRVRHEKPDYARQAMAAAFAEVNRLEGRLSRFCEGSDIWRINHAQAGERVRLSEETHACLLRAAELTALTRGAFDITLGAVVDRIRAAGGAELEQAELEAAFAGSGAAAAVVLDPAFPQAQVQTAGAALDLGAIGKGFALDQAAQLLADWSLASALLGAGGSSFLALCAAGEPPWQLTLSGRSQRVEVRLGNAAIGASGTAEQGRHIVDPLGRGQRYGSLRAWAIAPDAASADALSTAWMVLLPDEIEIVLEQAGAGYAALLEDKNGAIRCCQPGEGWRTLNPQEVLQWG